jgi:hypothetical protein
MTRIASQVMAKKDVSGNKPISFRPNEEDAENIATIKAALVPKNRLGIEVDLDNSQVVRIALKKLAEQLGRQK